ncbi:PKD domain-containing protein [Halorussus aquaticus]|uniref:PKD domain-containing protein n=1 Tax=Halorussus aquaticus TaxID=2953748 RepID=A0ABD5Q6W1_9EURY|nr:PKD domain-containing protein [Halorussus aquaticus]
MSIASTDPEPALGENVTFEATGYDPNSDYSQYNWTIEDSSGNVVTSGIWGKTIDYTFDRADTYTVYVIASSDYSGSKATDNINIGV